MQEQEGGGQQGRGGICCLQVPEVRAQAEQRSHLGS